MEKNDILNYELINNNSLLSNEIIDYSKENRIFTLNDFIEFYESYGVVSNDNSFKLEIEGLVELIKYKYLKYVSYEILDIINYKVEIDNTYIYKDINTLMQLYNRLGYNNHESYLLAYYSLKNSGNNIGNIIISFIRNRNKLYGSELYIQKEFINKTKLLLEIIKSDKREKKLRLK